MEYEYKKHHIAYSGHFMPDIGKYKPTVTITEVNGIQNRVTHFETSRFDKSFDTTEEAASYGIAFAKKWIDDGKPELKPFT